MIKRFNFQIGTMQEEAKQTNGTENDLHSLHAPLYLYLLNLCSWASLDGSAVKNPSAMQEMWVQSLGQEGPLENSMATDSRIFARNFVLHGQRSLVGYSP